MSIAEAAQINYLKRGALILINAGDAVTFLGVAKENRLGVLGIEGFRIDCGSVIPVMEAIADYSSAWSAASLQRDTIAEAMNFLSTMNSDALFYHFTLQRLPSV